jgi:hypothetical protein
MFTGAMPLPADLREHAAAQLGIATADEAKIRPASVDDALLDRVRLEPNSGVILVRHVGDPPPAIAAEFGAVPLGGSAINAGSIDRNRGPHLSPFVMFLVTNAMDEIAGGEVKLSIPVVDEGCCW